MAPRPFAMIGTLSKPAAETDEAAAMPDLTQVYAEHHQRVSRWVARLGGPRIEVEDLVQEIFLIVRGRLASFRGDSQLSTWIYGITRKVVARERRKAGLRAFMFKLGLKRELRLATTSAADPHEELEQRQAADQVYRALDAMRESYREVFILFEIERLPGEQIAVMTGRTTDAVWVLLHRARKQFLVRLEAIRGEQR
jgi:RNA polymerase sigma-70 factor, ECF subfamily